MLTKQELWIVETKARIASFYFSDFARDYFTKSENLFCIMLDVGDIFQRDKII